MKKSLQLSLVFFIFYFNAFSQKDKSIYIFGHSLVDHRPPIYATLSNETAVAHWMHFLAEEANNSVEISGQFGILKLQEDTVKNSSVQSQWGYEHVTEAWDSDNEAFSEVDFDAVVITPGNYVQWQGPSNNYVFRSIDQGTSPFTASITILDWVNEQVPDVPLYIYESWANMTGRTLPDGIFPPTAERLSDYYELNLSEYHDWFIEYHDLLLVQYPDIKMIPVGPILSKLLTLTPLNGISAEVLYEDAAPHGRPTTYFLAALITYMAIYEEKAPLTYIIPTNDIDNPVSPLVQANYEETVNFIWDELLAFNYEDGSSRVFQNAVLNINDHYTENSEIIIYPNPTDGIVSISGVNRIRKMDLFDARGIKLYSNENKYTNEIDLTGLSNGMYFVKIENNEHSTFIKRIVKQ